MSTGFPGNPHWGFLTPSRRLPGQHLQIGHEHILPNPYALILDDVLPALFDKTNRSEYTDTQRNTRRELKCGGTRHTTVSVDKLLTVLVPCTAMSKAAVPYLKIQPSDTRKGNAVTINRFVFLNIWGTTFLSVAVQHAQAPCSLRGLVFVNREKDRKELPDGTEFTQFNFLSTRTEQAGVICLQIISHKLYMFRTVGRQRCRRKITLQWMLRKQVRKLWIGYSWLKTGTRDGLLWTR